MEQSSQPPPVPEGAGEPGAQGVPDAGYYEFSRPNVQRLIRPGARRILDVGCAAGAMGADLKAQRPGLIVDGVEPVAAAARRAARHLDRVFVGRAEDAADTLSDGSYDVIVFADVLEHTVEPGRVLERLRPKLAPGGEIVVSLPNVRHWSVLRQLLEGRFDYVDLGILDRTHLRFFTRQTLLQLLSHHGFAVTHLERVLCGGAVPPSVLAALRGVELIVDTLEDEGAAYQYLLVARPARPLSPISDDAALRERLAEALASARAAAVALERGDSAAGKSALWALQLLALCCEATTPPRVSEELYQSFARVLHHCMARLARGAESLDGTAVMEGATALGSLLRALGG